MNKKETARFLCPLSVLFFISSQTVLASINSTSPSMSLALKPQNLKTRSGRENKNWDEHALRLTGESQRVTQQAIRGLQATPNLDEKLKLALTTPQKYLALDAIAALQRETLLPDLLALAPQDHSGAIYLTINTLMNPTTVPLIEKTYLTLLQSGKTPPHITKILLDTLGRIETKLPLNTLKKLASHTSNEVKSGTLYYLRYQLIKARDERYLPLLELFTVAKPYQLRIQLYSLLHDLPQEFKAKTELIKSKCREEHHPEVQAWCQELAG